MSWQAARASRTLDALEKQQSRRQAITAIAKSLRWQAGKFTWMGLLSNNTW